MKSLVFTLAILIAMAGSHFAVAEPEYEFDFEKDTEGWEIPDFAMEQGDHVARSLDISPDKSRTGKNSLKVECEFPGDLWTAALIEYKKDLDLRGFKSISADIYLPRKAKGDLYLARFILTVGPWYRVEMRNPVLLIAGKWNRIECDLDAGANEMAYWRCSKKEECVSANLYHVRKIDLRIEYNANPWQGGPPYNGPVYVDNIVIE